MNLTKKFTRNSLKRASGGGGVSDVNHGEDPSEMCARARAQSMRCSRSTLIRKQRKHRSSSRGPSSPYRSFGLEGVEPKDHDDDGPTVPNLSHPNDAYGQTYNDSEIITQMSSLTEPTWAGVDNMSSHHGQNQRSFSGRYQKRFQYHNQKEYQNRTRIAILEENDDAEREKLHLNENSDHLEQANMRRNEIEVNRMMGQDEHREDRYNDGEEENQTPNIQDGDMRDDVSFDHSTTMTPTTISSNNSTRRSKNTRRGEENSSRMRGRSGHQSTNHRTKRSLSASSHRSMHSIGTILTAPTLSNNSSSIITPVNDNSNRRRSQSIALKSSSSSSKRSQRSLSLPPSSLGEDEMRVYNKNLRCSRNHFIVKNIDRSQHSCEEATQYSSTQTTATLATTIATPDEWQEDCPPTPSSVAEAARMSLRGRLRRSNSNRSIASMQSESIVSTTTSRGPRTATTRKDVQSQRPPSYTLSSPSGYTSRIHKLAQDKIHKEKQQRRQEEDTKQKMRQEEHMKHKRRQQQEEEKEQRIARRIAAVTATSMPVAAKNIEEPQHTTLATLLCDFLLYRLLLLLSLPRYTILKLWCRLLNKKWTARSKTVLVTGATSALGSETAKQFAAEGANLILIASSSLSSAKSDLDWLVDECLELGSTKVRCYSADLSNSVSAELTLRQVAKDFNETIDVAVLNGVNMLHGCLFEEIQDSSHIEKMIKENTLSCMITLHFVLKYVPKTLDSRIVILSSTSGMVASPFKSVYVATHHALKGFCDSIRMELNNTYDKAPKVCLASFPDIVGQYTYHRDKVDHCVSWMGSEKMPMKIRSWAGIPLQHAVHDLLRAITLGKHNFGAPNYVSAWNCFRVIAPDWADFSTFRHFQKTQYRPVGNQERLGRKDEGHSMSNKTWA